jgi:uncharacterized membrane protein
LSSLLVAVATFLAAGVEWVEALTIVLAVGVFKSGRTAILATVAALGVLVLLIFGLGWLYKAILRSAGLKAQRDEAEEYQETREEVVIPEEPDRVEQLA